MEGRLFARPNFFALPVDFAVAVFCLLPPFCSLDIIFFSVLQMQNYVFFFLLCFTFGN